MTLSFQLDDDFITSFAGRQPAWGPIGYVTYKRTYARDLDKIYARHAEFATRAGLVGNEEFWLTLVRVVEGTFSILKDHCASLHLPWSDEIGQKKAREMYHLMWEFKFTPPGRGLWTMGSPVVARIGGAALNNCFAYETEIITADGVKQIGDLTGTTQRLLTTKGKWVDAPISAFGEQKLYAITLRRQGVDKVVHATADHRWFIRDKRKGKNDVYVETTTSKLTSNHTLQYVFGQGIKMVAASPFGIAHGFTFGDGGTIRGERNSNVVHLCGDKDQVMRRYFELCPEHSDKTDDVTTFSAIPNAFREKPSIRENKSYLLGWLSGYFAADGSMSSGGAKISSVDRSNIEFVRDVCAVLGIGTYAICEDERTSNLTNRTHTMYSIVLMRDCLNEDFFLVEDHRANFVSTGNDDIGKRYWNVVSVKATDRVETVYCATVEGTRAFALADNILTGNCGFVSTKNIANDFSSPFCALMDFSMLGVGIGFDVAGAGTLRLSMPVVDENDVHVVEDTREGWIKLLERALDAFVGRATLPSSVDYSPVRGPGAPIMGFGGTASGPGPLKELYASILRLLVACVERGGEVTTDVIVDVANMTGRCVVSGNVRRSAEIALGEPTDEVFMELKDRDKHAAALDSHRWASNNSVLAKVGQSYTTAARRTAKNGEPGFFWLENARAYGRMIDAPNHKDAQAAGTNPCSEQTLEDLELCCLVETYPAHHRDVREYRRTIKFAYLYAKAVTLVPTHNQRTNAVTMKNRRIGCSMSGIVQAMAKFGRRKFVRMCDESYAYIQELDAEYSNWLCIPRSIKTTSVKPSGTVSLLCQATPGIHHPLAEYYWRVIRFASDSAMLPALEAAGYECVEIDPAKEPNTTAVYFPVRERDFERAASEVSMWEQLELAALLQAHWADNQVSATVTFDKKVEGPQIARALELYETRLKGVSFLPSEDHGYDHAPYQPITRERYELAVAALRPLDLSRVGHEVTDAFCDGGKCEIPARGEVTT